MSTETQSPDDGYACTAPRCLPGQRAIDELTALLEYPDRQLADPLAVGLVPAVEELINWLEHDGLYDKNHHQESWQSLIRDFQHAIGLLGAHLCGAIAAQLQGAAELLTSLIDQAGDLNREAKQQGLTALVVLRWRLGEPEALAAVWNDLCRGCQDMERDADQVLIQRDLLLDLLRLTGRDIRSIARRLYGVMRNNRHAVESAQAAVNGTDATLQENDLADMLTPAVLSESQRLSLCRELIAIKPEPADHVVWFAVSGLPYNPPARISEQVTFYPYSWLRMLLDAEERNGTGLPEEFTNDCSWMLTPTLLPGGQDDCLARVALGQGSWADVEREALRLLLRDFSGLAQYGAGARPQVLREEGYLHIRDGKLGGRRYNPTFPPPADSVYRAISRASDLVDYLSRRPGGAAGLHDDLERQRALESADGREALGLAQNIIESRYRALGITRTGGDPIRKSSPYGWYSYCREFLKCAWVSAVVSAHLSSAARNVFYGPEPKSPDSLRRLAALRQEVITYQRGGPVLDRSAFLAALPAVLACTPPARHAQRELHELVRWTASSETRSRWVKTTEERFELGLDRFRRIRNAHAHGGPAATEGAIRSVRELATWLARTAIEVTIHPDLRSRPLHKGHKEYQKGMRQWQRSLVTATALDQLQWP